MSDTFRSISELQKFLSEGCKVESVQPSVFASDAEVNIATVTVICPDGNKHSIRAYRDEARALREYIRLRNQ